MRKALHIFVLGLVLIMGLSQLGAPAAAMTHARAMDVAIPTDCAACPDGHHQGQPAQDMPCPHAQMMVFTSAVPTPALTLSRADLSVPLRPAIISAPRAHEPQLDLPPPRI
jgi:hypothetical protein